ncbi:MAG: LysE family translocator [Sneathiella sp.]
MGWGEILSFILVAALLVMSPGPNGALIAKTVPLSGRKAGFANVAGFVAAFYLHGALSVFGISLLLVKSAEAFFIVKMVGAAYLIWIGVKALREALKGPGLPNQVSSKSYRVTLSKAFSEGFLTNALNPKVTMFYLSAFPQFIPVGGDAATSAFVLVCAHSLINAIWFSALIVLFFKLTAATKKSSFQKWLKGVTGAVFIGFGVKLMTLKP